MKATWPQNTAQNKIAGQMVCFNDLVATFATITGQKLPSDLAQESFEFSPLFGTSNYTKPIRLSLIHHSVSGIFSIRRGHRKYVEGAGSGGWPKDDSPSKEWPAQLYDLENDPDETLNLLEVMADTAQELKGLLGRQRMGGYTRPGTKK